MDIKKLGNSEIEINLSIPWKEWEKYLVLAVEDISKNIKIEGFRPGKAPKDMIEKKVGKEAILNEAAEKAIKKNYSRVVLDEKLDVIGAPNVEILKLAEGNDLEYKIKTAVMPEVKMNNWTEGVKKINKKQQEKKTEVSKEEIKKELEKLANSRVQLITVDREARKDDSVEIDFQVSLGGVPIENGTSKKHNLILGRGVFIPGFEENVIGMSGGDEKEFELEFPKDYHAKDLAGKKATFKVKLNIVQERKTPQIDNAFAVSLGNFKDLSELEKSIEDGIFKEKEIQKKEENRSEIVEFLIGEMKVELPEILIHEELHRMIGEFEAQLSGMGMNVDGYLEKMSAHDKSGKKKTRQDLEKEWEPQAEKRIKSALVLEEIAKQKEIEIASEKIEKEMNKLLAQYKGVKDLEKNMDMSRVYNYVKGMLTNDEVFKLLEGLK
ncbi:MAG: Trigger factor [Candidatus Moranbacteria bacterium GW2011_GWE2_35_2-]|nr:MAG: Trigger factor [Candidatus Moranbacteria bacterium GW2011_GWE2_35_2-]KKQ22187.1 MAG: Trigger factor [Candidatus Moranbacteria bacterium GW2011_GWF2_37_11]KKQ28757.1 MAG: Trigger factor [Candidatus Moranbacteria bacterium GW2011_GWD1_37_17]KKQ30321.1 MAG: Trigger factor [Candidatus Moranbacteria bacterium GW2011_GWE1_37_24]KKQ47353.1 MAG: Trigger factor [Candidatus Moranbacteria bacterium GW2011_GWD2_37_9]HBO16649.1 trigger factor [Candidatus Moranbacteria bacterium]